MNKDVLRIGDTTSGTRGTTALVKVARAPGACTVQLTGPLTFDAAPERPLALRLVRVLVPGEP